VLALLCTPCSSASPSRLDSTPVDSLPVVSWNYEESSWMRYLSRLLKPNEAEPKNDLPPEPERILEDGGQDDAVQDDAVQDDAVQDDAAQEESTDDYFDDGYVPSNDTYTRDDDFYYEYVRDPLPPSLVPVAKRDVIGFMLASLGVCLGSSGGIGGGGLVVPIYIIALGLPTRIAIPLGSVTVFGGSMAGLLLNLRRRHPLADRPIIDWDLILVMEPLVLTGALLGGLLHRSVSEKILMVLLVLLLSISAHATLTKAKRMYDAEVRYIEHLKDYIDPTSSFRSAFHRSGWSNEAVPEGEAESKTTESANTSTVPLGRTMSLESKTDISEDVSQLYNDERLQILILNPDFVTIRSDLVEQERRTSGLKIIVLLGKFAVLIFLNITLGGGAFDSPWGIQCGSVAYYVVHVIMVVFLMSSAWAAQVSRLSFSCVPCPLPLPTFSSYPFLVNSADLSCKST
jgi:hypothetical protein